VRAPLTVAAAQPPCAAGDVRRNAGAHAEAVRAARARVVVFPELSLTGYELEAQPVAPEDPALAPVLEACAATGALALVGAPVPGEDGRVHIGVLALSPAGAAVAYRKTWLGDAEAARFTPGEGPAALAVDGWRLGLGVCKDTGVAAHVEGTAALGVDAYVAGLVHRPEELAVQEARAVAIARACRAYVAFASFAGATGGGYDRTAGASAVWSPSGGVLAQAGARPGEIARATLV
jgi:predicted amidohydrolase